MHEEKSDALSTTIQMKPRPPSRPAPSTLPPTPRAASASAAAAAAAASSASSVSALASSSSSLLPIVPPRSTPFSLDASLSRLELELTGRDHPNSVPSFSPTNFYIQWPARTGSDGGEEHRGTTRADTHWISPKDLLADQTPRLPSSADFPRELHSHRAPRSRPGEVSPPGSSRRSGGRSRQHIEEFLRDKTRESYSGAKPRTAGEKNMHVGPGTYESPRTAAMLHRCNYSFKPAPPKPFEDRGLIQGPAVGSYQLTNQQTHVPVLHFGGGQKTHARMAANNLHRAEHRGGPPPGTYDAKEPTFGGEPKGLIFLRSERFAGPGSGPTSHTGNSISASSQHSLGPGSFNVAAIGAIGSSTHRVASFSARGSGSTALPAGFKRSTGPAVGSYNPSDGMDIGHTPLLGASLTAVGSACRPHQHKFSTSARFDYQTRPHPLYALVILDAKKRQGEMVKNFKPNLTDFQAQRREELLQMHKQKRMEREAQAEANRRLLHAEHLRVQDRILNRDLYRAQQRELQNHAEFLNFVRKGWLFYVALTSRTQLIKESVRRVRTARNLRLLTTNAARTIVTYARRWAAKAHAKRVARASRVVYRALRRNVIRAHLRRKRRAARCLLILLANQYNKNQALQAIAKYKSKAILIQRAMRSFLLRKHHACRLLLKAQWDRLEGMLAIRYQTEVGDKAFEKIRKKGLLIRNMTAEQQREKIIQEVPFDYISQPLKLQLIEEDYLFRLRAYRVSTYQWLRTKRIYDALPADMPLGERVAMAQQKEEEERRQMHSSPFITERPTEETSASASMLPPSAAAAAVAAAGGLPPPPPFDPTRPPYFHRLIPALRMFSLITTAQAKQFSARAEQDDDDDADDADPNRPPPPNLPELRKKFKLLIGGILKQLQKQEAKEKKAREKALAAEKAAAEKAAAAEDKAAATGEAAAPTAGPRLPAAAAPSPMRSLFSSLGKTL